MKNQRWHIIYEDEELILVDKPTGLLSIPDRFDPAIDNLAGSLRKYRDEIFVNHRLDKDTSGLILFSKSADSHQKMQALFEAGQIRKEYRALVHGSMSPDEGEITHALKYDNSRKRTIISSQGKASRTAYSTITAWRNYAYLHIQLYSGRTHQIRAHLSHEGHPLLCDPIYGNGKPFYLSEVKKNYRHHKDREERPLLSRTALHAHGLGFRNPYTGEEQYWTADMPRDMKAVVNQLNKLETA